MRIRELEDELFLFTLEAPRKRAKTIEEWKLFSKHMRHGLRIAKRFNHTRGIHIFGTMYTTALKHIQEVHSEQMYQQVMGGFVN
jgi:hypothetical protein